MSRIKDITETAKRQGSKLLIPYLIAGDPNITVTLQLMHQLVASGADIIEPVSYTHLTLPTILLV